MKLIPNAIGRKIASQGLTASENAPKILFIGGVVGMVGSTVLACRATLKLEETLEQVERDKQQAHDVHEHVNSEKYEGNAEYTDQDLRKDLTVVSVRGVVAIGKLYAPSVLLGAASIFALTKSHNILQERNLAITAAYAAVDTAFSRYRDRVVDRFGQEVDDELRYDSEAIDVVDEDTGKVRSEVHVTGAPGSAYARFYDEHSSRCWSQDPDLNLMFLRNAQNYLNDRLMARGHVFLNEAYRELGLSDTKAGAVVGWRWNQGSGDDFIDFGIWNGTQENVNDFFNGREGAILLDFNVDGVIYDKLPEG